MYTNMYALLYLQQSIFLVVIIESFAGLRGDSYLDSSKKDKKKPVIVLEHSDDNLRLQYLKNHESTTAFEKMLKKYYVDVIEKLFLILVLVDAVVTATKHTGMCDTWLLVLRFWQVTIIYYTLKFVHSFAACSISLSPLSLHISRDGPDTPTDTIYHIVGHSTAWYKLDFCTVVQEA